MRLAIARGVGVVVTIAACVVISRLPFNLAASLREGIVHSRPLPAGSLKIELGCSTYEKAPENIITICMLKLVIMNCFAFAVVPRVGKWFK